MIVLLAERGVLEVAGEDRVAFLQGLVSNDVTAVSPGRAVWAALLTPQGKWLADFFIIAHQNTLLLDCEGGQLAELQARLSRFRVRAKVTLRDASADWHVHAAWGETPQAEIVVPDPRHRQAGFRALSSRVLAPLADLADWHRHRIALGLPDGSRDMEAEKSVLLEAGFDELGGVSWSKGCYMGQELTARTKYRGLLKRRLVPVALEGALPQPGTPILHGAEEVGVLREGVAGTPALAMALLRLEALALDGLTCDGIALHVARPDWMA